jgi:hypothetical protein
VAFALAPGLPCWSARATLSTATYALEPRTITATEDRA